MSAAFGHIYATPQAPPEPIYRCPLDWWRLKRGLSTSELAKAVGTKPAALGRHFRDPADPRFLEAGLGLRQRVLEYTGGMVRLEDWPAKIKKAEG